MIGRRAFLLSGGLALVAAGLRPFPLMAATGVIGGPVADRLGKAAFTPLLWRWLQFSDPANGHAASLKLVEVQDWPGMADMERFSLVFRGRFDTQLPEGTYQVASRYSPPFELFIKPVSAAGTGADFVADFSLLR